MISYTTGYTIIPAVQFHQFQFGNQFPAIIIAIGSGFWFSLQFRSFMHAEPWQAHLTGGCKAVRTAMAAYRRRTSYGSEAMAGHRSFVLACA